MSVIILAPTYTLTIDASQGEDPLTRALTTDGTNISATWTHGDLVSVYNVTKSAALGGTLTALSSGSTVKLSGELTGTVAAGDVLKLTYQTTDDFTGQDGTLEYILDHYDYATASYHLNNYSTFDPGKYYKISVKMKPISITDRHTHRTVTTRNSAKHISLPVSNYCRFGQCVL